MPEEFNIVNRNIIEDLNELHNDTVIWTRRFCIGYTMTVQKKLDDLCFTLECNDQREEEEEDQHISMILWNRIQMFRYMYICLYSCVCILSVLFYTCLCLLLQ
jgi:hypothetical protein